MQITIKELTDISAQHPYIKIYFSNGRIRVNKNIEGCPICSGRQKFYNGSLGFEGLECNKCGFMEDANNDANRDNCDESMSGALYSLRIPRKYTSGKR